MGASGWLWPAPADIRLAAERDRQAAVAAAGIDRMGIWNDATCFARGPQVAGNLNHAPALLWRWYLSYPARTGVEKNDVPFQLPQLDFDTMRFSEIFSGTGHYLGRPLADSTLAPSHNRSHGRSRLGVLQATTNAAWSCSASMPRDLVGSRTLRHRE